MRQCHKKRVFPLAFVLFAIIINCPLLSQQSENCTLLGRWAAGQCYDVLANGPIAYMGNGAYLQIMQASDPVNPVLLGKIVLPEMIRKMAFYDNKIYVADYNGGLRIVDVSDPSAPREISAIEKIGTAIDLVLDGNYAYIAAGNSSLIIIDITDPSNPVKLGQLENTGYLSSVAVQGDYAFVCLY